MRIFAVFPLWGMVCAISHGWVLPVYWCYMCSSVCFQGVVVFEVRGSSNHPCPGRAVGKTDLVMVAVQGAPEML